MPGRFVGRTRELGLGCAAARVSAAQLPGHDAAVGTVVVSLSGVGPGVGRDVVDVLWGADDVVAAWV